MNTEVHAFVVENQGHPQMMDIHAELQRLSGLMHGPGYIQSIFSLLNIS